jgi:hypothetical protein
MGVTRVRRSIWGLAAAWAVLLVAAFVAPQLIPGDDPADLVTRQTARVAVLFWALAAGAILLRFRDHARWAWALGSAAFCVHVTTAFDRVHGWSHVAAIQHVESVSGFGAGLFVSYAFTALWVADAGWWMVAPASYDARPAWFDRGIHAFMAFVVFNGTVVYETGLIRQAGIVIFAGLAVLVVWRLSRRER